ncbi:MAG: hypothetical protein OXE53_00525 [Deltaproteobacteria bacterium]|nr:hypothetical protein [Deltaproteobacteria bacterium]
MPTSGPTSTETTGAAVAITSDEIRSDRERAAPATVGSDLESLVDGNSAFAFAFAFDLFHALKAQDGNLFYSPHSIRQALAMTSAGANGQTASQMADTLRFSLTEDRLHPAFNALAYKLASRTGDTDGQDGEGFRLNIVNAVWGQQDHKFQDAFLDFLAESYGTGVRPTDFRGAPEESRRVINDWVAERTGDKGQGPDPAGHHQPADPDGFDQRNLLQRFVELAL